MYNSTEDRKYEQHATGCIYLIQRWENIICRSSSVREILDSWILFVWELWEPSMSVNFNSVSEDGIVLHFKTMSILRLIWSKLILAKRWQTLTLEACSSVVFRRFQAVPFTLSNPWCLLRECTRLNQPSTPCSTPTHSKTTIAGGTRRRAERVEMSEGGTGREPEPAEKVN